MSKLRWADYSQHLAGKIIRQIRWFNDPEENFWNLSIVFEDETRVDFCFKLGIDEEAEIADFRGGDISNERLLHPVPVKRPDETPHR